jgi:ribonuclease HI
MRWQPYRLRDADVWARVDEAGQLVADKDGRVEVVYKAAPGAKVYRAAARNLVARDGAPVVLDAVEPAPAPSTARPAPTGPATMVWTDGGANPNPGPAGIGVVVIEDGKRRELSEFLGQGTNQIAELAAIVRGLEMVTDRTKPVIVHSDSAYAIGLATKSWKAKANVELVEKMRGLVRAFPDVRFVKVLGHSGVTENERCDQLAGEAIATRRSRAT